MQRHWWGGRPSKELCILTCALDGTEDETMWKDQTFKESEYEDSLGLLQAIDASDSFPWYIYTGLTQDQKIKTKTTLFWPFWPYLTLPMHFPPSPTPWRLTSGDGIGHASRSGFPLGSANGKQWQEPGEQWGEVRSFPPSAPSLLGCGWQWLPSSAEATAVGLPPGSVLHPRWPGDGTCFPLLPALGPHSSQLVSFDPTHTLRKYSFHQTLYAALTFWGCSLFPAGVLSDF